MKSPFLRFTRCTSGAVMGGGGSAKIRSLGEADSDGAMAGLVVGGAGATVVAGAAEAVAVIGGAEGIGVLAGAGSRFGRGSSGSRHLPAEFCGQTTSGRFNET